jgi:hypothetical protein
VRNNGHLTAIRMFTAAVAATVAVALAGIGAHAAAAGAASSRQAGSAARAHGADSAGRPKQPGAPANIHYMPVPGSRPSRPLGQLVYHGGQVMRQQSNTYAIFWEPPKLQNGDPAYVDPDYNRLIKLYFKDIGGSGLYENNTQYYQTVDGKNQFIKNVSQLAGAWVDTADYPASGCNDPATPGNCLTDAQIRAEVQHAMQVNGWTASATNMFLVFTAKGEGSCFTQGGSCAFTTYCAYHGASGATIYANMPYGATQSRATRKSCTRKLHFPNNVDADIETNITSHEQIEAVTDPYLNAWYDPSGQEIGDLCVYNYGTLDEDGGVANQQWNGHYYLMQMEWDNAQAACVQEGP